MDVHSIKQHIINNPDYIEDILNASGFYKIKEINRDEYRCAFDYDTNATSVKVDKNTLASSDFARGVSGDIITLVEYKMGLDFRETLSFICEVIGVDAKNMPKKNKPVLPFGGFFKDIGVNRDKYNTLETINNNVLDQFLSMPSKKFCDDGIPAKQQLKYQIGYDSMSGRIIIPHWNTMGDLVGIMGRYNGDYETEEVLKYFPIISFPKSQVIYGYHHNYKNIQKDNIAIICESEKSVMKLDAMGIKTGLALGGNSISSIQAKNIQSACPKIIILGLDEGLEESFVVNEAEKLTMENPFINIKVGYIWDSKNEIMKEGTKVAPMDKSKKEFEYLIKHCVKWL